MTSSGKTLAQTLAAIEALDLAPIKFKAMLSVDDDGYGWTAERAQHAATAYKRQLILSAKHPETTLVPDRDTDRFWHLHILDTMKYAADCDAIFGHFIHHHPGFGLRGVDDARAAEEAFATTQRLLVQEFGESAIGTAAWCGATNGAKAAWCGATNGAEAAWCGATNGAKAAWCGATNGAKAAWCGATNGAKAAWCGATNGAKAAWCGATNGAKAACDDLSPSIEVREPAERLAA
jgi:hypothetical protein